MAMIWVRSRRNGIRNLQSNERPRIAEVAAVRLSALPNERGLPVVKNTQGVDDVIERAGRRGFVQR
jgi:hypothetical protein